MDKYPLVSLIIISYNQEDYIDDCMKSLLELTYANLEILYLDDNSSDETFARARLYEAKLKERYVSTCFYENALNQGLINNLNGLIKQCHGKYIKFMAADDFLLPESISTMVNFMETHPKYDMIYTNGVRGNENTHFPLQNERKLSSLYLDDQLQGNNLFEKLYERDFIAAPTVMIRGEVYKRLGLYDTHIGIEDWEYFLRIAKQGSIGYLNKTTVMYRFTEDSLSHSDAPEKRINMQKSGLLIQEKYKADVQNSIDIITESYNRAYQDALHIGNKSYLKFLSEYAERNQIKIAGKNILRYILYRLKIFRLLDKR